MARLPNPGGDSGTWGTILNEYLASAHNADGSIKTSALGSAGAELASAKGQPGGYAPLDSSSKVPAANLPATTAPPDADATTKGLVQLAGDLAGTAASPQIATGAITNADINASAAIAQSKIASLTSDLAAKQSISERGQANGYASLGASGLVPITQLASGTPDGTKFIRDDGVLIAVGIRGTELAYAARRDAALVTAHAWGTVITGLTTQFTLTETTRVLIEAYLPLVQINGTGANGRADFGITVNGVRKAYAHAGNASTTGLQFPNVNPRRTLTLSAGVYTLALQGMCSGTGNVSVFGEIEDDDGEYFIRAEAV